MSARLLKFANRVYKIFKVYVAIAVGGALIAVLVQLILAKPLALLVTLASVACLIALIWSWLHSDKSIAGHNLLKLQPRKPPKL